MTDLRSKLFLLTFGKVNFEYVKSTLPPMGLMPIKDESFFKTTNLDISDKTILIYTDGVTEGYVDEGQELEVVGLENEIKKLNSTSIHKLSNTYLFIILILSCRYSCRLQSSIQIGRQNQRGPIWFLYESCGRPQQ